MGWEIRDNFWERTGKAWLLHGPRITVGLNVRTARTDHLVNVDNFYITSLVFIRIFVNEPNCLDSMGLFSVHWVHPLKLRVASWELYHCRPNLILPKCEDTVQWSPPPPPPPLGVPCGSHNLMNFSWVLLLPLPAKEFAAAHQYSPFFPSQSGQTGIGLVGSRT